MIGWQPDALAPCARPDRESDQAAPSGGERPHGRLLSPRGPYQLPLCPAYGLFDIVLAAGGLLWGSKARGELIHDIENQLGSGDRHDRVANFRAAMPYNRQGVTVIAGPF